jgi:hypothetical protein
MRRSHQPREVLSRPCAYVVCVCVCVLCVCVYRYFLDCMATRILATLVLAFEAQVNWQSTTYIKVMRVCVCVCVCTGTSWTVLRHTFWRLKVRTVRRSSGKATSSRTRRTRSAASAWLSPSASSLSLSLRKFKLKPWPRV